MGRTQWQMTQKGKIESDKLSDEMSLLKIRRNMSDSQWKEYRQNMLNNIQKPKLRIETRNRLDKADLVYKQQQTDLNNKISELNKEISDLNNKISEQNMSKADKEMAANNRIYESYLEKADNELLPRLEQLRGDVEKQGVRTKQQAEELDYLTKRLQDLRSKGLVFANEAYHTPGALKHVVLNQQGKQGIPVTKDEYLHSINEQTGFVVEQINHNKDMGTALWKSSKYVGRVINAVKNIKRKHTDFETPKKHDQIKELTTKLLKIKKDDKLTEVEKSKQAEKAAKEKGYNSKDEYLKDVLDMNLELNQNIRKKPGSEDDFSQNLGSEDYFSDFQIHN